MPKRPTLSDEVKAELGRDLVDWWIADNEDRAEWLADLPRWARAYQGKPEPKDLPWPGASNLHVPVTATVMDALHPRLMTALLRPDPVVHFRPQEPSDLDRTQRQEQFLDWGLREDMQAEPVLDRTILSMLQNGIAVTKQTWHLQIRRIRDPHRFPLDTPLDQAIQAIYASEVATVEALTRVSQDVA